MGNQCDQCAYLIFDEEAEEYICDCQMDEDDFYYVTQGRACPYYRNGDEYSVVKRQM